MATLLESPARTSVRDPVCGMEIEPKDTVAKRTVRDVAYYFCSDRCVAAFDADPERFTATVSATTGVAVSSAATAQITLTVANLRPAGAPALERVIVAVPGVVGAIVNVKDGRVVVECDPMRASVADLLATIRGAGFSPAGQTLRLKVSGLYCAECVARIEESLKAVPGVLDATMNAATNEIKVEYSAGCRRPEIADARHRKRGAVHGHSRGGGIGAGARPGGRGHRQGVPRADAQVVVRRRGRRPRP